MLRLSVSYGRREGRPEFSSESAECGLQVDLESSWLDDAVYLQERIKAAYQMCVDAVDVQLHAVPAAQAPPETVRNGNGHSNGNGAYGAPTTGKTFLGWLKEKPDSVKDAVKAIVKARNLPTLYMQWSDDDAQAVYAEVTEPPRELSDHEKFMVRCEQKKAEEKATSAAWVAGIGRGAYASNGKR